MDVTFTNVLEGARQYFQGLPTTASSTACPAFSSSSEILHCNNETEPNSEMPPSSSAYWASHQPETVRPPTREQTPVQRPPSHHSDSASRTPSHSQMVNMSNHDPGRQQMHGHYQGNYQEQQQQQNHSFQFSRPHSRDAPSNITQHQYVVQNSPYHQPLSPQQPRTQSRQEQIATSSSHTYHQLQSPSKNSQNYQSYQQQQHQQQLQQQQLQQQRSYYPAHSQTKQQMPTSNNINKIASTQPYSQNSSENAYYKHLYTAQNSQTQYANMKPPLPHSVQENKQEQTNASHNQPTSQAYRTTHNLPPIASLSLISYHSNRNNNRDVARTSSTKTRTPPVSNNIPSNVMNQNCPKTNASVQQQQQGSSRIPTSFPSDNVQQDYRNSSQYTNQSNRLPINQNYHYGATTTTTQNYNQVIMTTSNTSSSYTAPIPNQSSSSNQHYYQSNKLPTQDVQRNHVPPSMLPQQQPTTVQQLIFDRNVSERVQTPVVKQKRESPLDLSVKTVRTPADSTLDDAEQDARSNYYGSGAASSSNRTLTNTSHNYPTYDIYASSFQRNLTSRSSQLPSVTVPKVEFYPNFNVSALNHSHLNSYNNRRNSVQNVPDNKNLNSQRMSYDKNVTYQTNQQNTSRYPTVAVPTAAHVNSYIQSSPPKRVVENVPRVDLPPTGHGHKALYSVPSQDTQKRPADVPPSPVIPDKVIKKDAWWRNIDQEIEQRFITYKEQQAKHNSSNKPEVVNGNYPTVSQSKEMYNSYQRQQYQAIPQHHSYNNANQYSQTTHNQTYVPSVGAHQYPGYSSYQAQSQQRQQHLPYHQANLPRTNSNSSLSTSGTNKNSVGGADKRVLSLLRNSLEIKGAKEAQKKLEQEQINRSYENIYKHSRPDVQHPSTDVTAPLQPKATNINRQNISPFTPISLLEGNNNLAAMYKLHIPKAIDSVNYEPETNNVEDSQAQINQDHLDGLAAFLAARIKTKAELKQAGLIQNNNNSQLQSLIESQLKTPMKQDNSHSGSSNSVSPPKLIKERHSFAPRRRLFSRNEDDSGNSSNVPPRDKSGLRSSSETSVFDFPDSESETEMPVLERQTLEDMRRDRKTSSKQISEIKSDSSRPTSPSDDFFMQACDSFMEQLKSGSGKKRGRRKKCLEADVLAQLESVTKQKPLDLDVTIKKETDYETAMKNNEIKFEESVNNEQLSTKMELNDDDDDSDILLVQAKTNDELKDSSYTKSPARTNLIKSSSLNDITNLEDDDDFKSKEAKQKSIKRKSADSQFLKDVTTLQPRPAKKPCFGDGSHFYPGWEEEVYKYKKSLRMPPNLIQVTRPPQYHRLSTSLPDLDPCPNSPTPSLVIDTSECPKVKLSKVKSESIDSDNDSNYSFNLFSNKNNYDSEGSSSIKSLPNTIKESNSILDKLLERYGDTRKRKYKKKVENHPKVIPKSEKVLELLPTPSLEVNPQEIKKANLECMKTFGFRKQTIENFKEVFLGNSESVHSHTRISRMKKRATIKEVFGEDRPASAPPVTCVNHIKIKEEPNTDDNISVSSLIKKENDASPDHQSFANFTDTKQVLKNKLLNRGRRSDSLLKCLVDKRIKTELLDEQDLDGQDEDDDGSIKGDADCKSGTPSIDGDEISVLGRRQRNKFRNARRKYSSGFDYLRKKNKKKKDHRENDTTLRQRKRGPLLKTNSGSEQDIQKEIKGWVLNKGIGETILHRAARLGYTDITAYCLEKMEYSPSPKDNAGYTPLHEASTKGHLAIAKMLLMYGANVSESARGGIRPLHEAVENGYVEIVRLLLSYGADPMLATYSGMTPLSLTTDETTQQLLQDHINDLQGKSGSPWIFAGPASCFDVKEAGFEVLEGAPETDPLSEEEDVEFEMSDTLLPNLYTLRGEPPNDRWILLQDLSNLLKIKSRDALLRQICPPTSNTSPVNYKSVLRELKMSDFLEQAHCCQFLNISEKVNTRASKIALVKYTDKVKELLNVENVTISVR